ncbi:NAD-dependent succinate-semialdehyde dehydrogenase [Nocardioides gilvus]|uniref:NAD-dependent succinate-semialdehyde dehydrogenase n=1 Tax=Nocardioides gilvus TaxID=1735589 RepID=UPI000D74CB67|nr:NAD-dependent succinate-semialdehyde dehydrogenase [Nocardioides gilvus]
MSRLVDSLIPACGSLVADQWLVGDRATFDVQDPATTSVVAAVARAEDEDVVAAVDAAAGALPGWSATSPRRRSEVLRRAFELMLERSDDLADLIVAENGKSRADAVGEVTYAAEFFRWYSEEAVRAAGAFGSAPAGGARTLVQRRPVGVSVLITPWNFPAAMMTRKVAPALAAGCSVVVKPASETPLTALAIGQILLQAGAPAGVVNVVTTDDSSGSVKTMLAHEAVRKLSFTGSTRVGSLLLSQAAERVLNCSMELGGNAPFVVTASADVEAAVEGAMVAKFRNGGQACTAANRFYVHADVVDDFVAAWGARIEALVVGAGASGAAIGPMISARARDGLVKLVDRAVAAGAVVAARAELPDLPGHFVAPTLLTGVAPDAEILAEELFGPVAPVVVWDDFDELVRQANGTEMGLASFIYSQDLGEALRLAEAFEIGMVGINRGVVSDPATPFGGTKHSGIGREGASEGMEAYLETQYVSIGWE